MGISEQDREWVRAIVKEAALEAMLQSRNQLYSAIKEHGEMCAGKWRGYGRVFLAGVIVCSLLTGSGMAVLAGKILKLL